jgi:hypothetical protein
MRSPARLDLEEATNGKICLQQFNRDRPATLSIQVRLNNAPVGCNLIR